jgi:hypothetical protein
MILVFAAGCGLLKIVAEKKLTPKEVLIKAAHTVQKSKGFSYKLTGNQTLEIASNGQSQSVNQSFEGQIDLTNQPHAMHMTMTLHSQGQKIPVNMYLVGDVLYQQTPDGSGWLKTKGVNLNAAAGNSQNPNEALQKLEELLAKIQTPEEKKMLNMKETTTAYELEITIDDQTGKSIKDEILKLVKEAMLSQFKQLGIPVDVEQIKLNQFVEKITIGKKTFNQQKMVQHIKIEIPVKDSTVSGALKADLEMVINMTGEFNGTITVPEDVKNNAREVQDQQSDFIRYHPPDYQVPEEFKNYRPPEYKVPEEFKNWRPPQ